MGKVIAKKIKGMSWAAKISLVLIFTMMFSVFMYQGWYKPTSAEAATQTTAGTVTARATASTSLQVTMPYTGDDTTPNNTYTVDYKTCAAGVYTNWVTGAAHVASPFTTTITGLTANACYNIRATYIDADGVVGTNPQTIQISAGWDDTLLHNSNRFPGTTKQGGDWGTPTGVYGQIVCETCHTKSTTNIKRIKTPVTAPSGSFPGSTVNFQSVTTPDGFGDDTGGHATSQKICQVCHSVTAYHKYNQPADPGHNNNSDCTVCHPHSLGFVGGGTCDSCHGAPPGAGSDTNAPAAYAASHARHYDLTAGGLTTSYTASSNRSTATAYVYDCGICHSTVSGDHTANSDGTVDVKFNSSYAGGTWAAGSYTGGDNPPPPGSVTFKNSSGTCSSVYCHGNFTGGTTGNVATWGNTASGACGTCHGATAAAPPANANHSRHVGSAAGGLSLACDVCHEVVTAGSSLGDLSLHVNKATNWNLKRTDNKIGATGVYNGAESGIKSPPSATYATCSSVYCHSNVQGASGSGVPSSFGTPTWGSGALACSSTNCHDSMSATSGGTGSHQKHAGTAAGNYNIACSVCHSGAGDEAASHANYLIDMSFTGTATGTAYSQAGTPGNGWGTCSTSYCHSNANPVNGSTNTYQASLAWGGTTTCLSCHRGQESFANMGLAGTPDRFSLAHKQHVAIDRYGYTCDECHAETMTDNSFNTLHATTGYIKHVNAAKDWKFATTATAGSINQSGGSYAAYNCTATYCHSKGQATASPFTAPIANIAWNSGSAATCTTCHGGKDTVANVTTAFAPGTGKHGKHIGTTATGGYNYDCDECHTETTAANSSTALHATTGYTKHVDGSKSWKFSANILNPDSGYSQAAGSYSGGNCTNTYCHSTGVRRTADPVTYPYTGLDFAPYQTPSWTGTLTNCNGCHGDATYTTGRPDYTNGTPKANSHVAHTQTCEKCHNATTTNGSNITNIANHVNFAYNVSNLADTITYTPGALAANGIPAGGTCSGTFGCHGSATWGGPSMSCLSCHNSITGSNAVIGRRQITATNTAPDGTGGTAGTGDFTRASRHVSNGTTTQIVTKWDCVICHLEGNPATGGTSTDHTGTPDGGADINLRNVDNYTAGWAWNKTGAKTTAMRDNMDSFCMACHDSDTSYSTASPWYVPESGDGRIVWASTTGAVAPKTNVYTARSDAFEATEEVSTGVAAPGAAPIQMVLKASPTNKNEMVAGYVTSGGVLEVLCYNNGTWTKDWTVTVGGTGTTRRFDIAYETNSGDVMVAYVPNAVDAYNYRYKLGSSACGSANWPAAGANIAPASTAGTLTWIRLEADPRAASNVISLAWLDSAQDIAARKWNGTAWGTESAVLDAAAAFVTAASDTEAFDIAFESQSGDLMIAWGREANTNFWYSTSAVGTDTYSAAASIASTAEMDHIDLATNPNTNRILMGGMNSGADVIVSVWDGTSAWTTSLTMDAAAQTPAAGRKFAAAGWLINGATERGIITYYDSGTTNIGWVTLSGTAFTLAADVLPAPPFGAQTQYDIQMDPINKDRLMFLVSDANSDIFAKRLVMESDGTFQWTDSDDGAIETTTSTATYKPWAFAYQRKVGSGNRGGGASTIAVNATNTGMLTGTVAAPVARRYTPFNINDTLLIYREEISAVATQSPLKKERRIRGRAQRSDETAQNTESKGYLVDVKGQFNYRGLTGKNWASHHNLNQFTKRYSTNNTTYLPAAAWEAYVTKEGVNLNTGASTTAGLHCSDCHLNEVNAHGASNAWYMASDRSGADAAATATGTSTGTDHCFKCHSRLAYGEGGTSDASRVQAHNAGVAGRCNNIEGGAATDTTDVLAFIGAGGGGSANIEQFPCLGCHGGRDFGEIHGMNKRYRVGSGSTDTTPSTLTKRYRFMSGASMRYYSPTGADAPADPAGWEGAAASDAGCYTVPTNTTGNPDITWGNCNNHTGGYIAAPVNRVRLLEY